MKSLLVTLVIAGAVLAADNGAASKKKNRTQPKAESAETLTGCVDQRGETYILAGGSMKQEAKLAGKAFTDDNFARYIGHTVTVHGTVDRTSSPMVVQVTRVDDVKETCR